MADEDKKKKDAMNGITSPVDINLIPTNTITDVPYSAGTSPMSMFGNQYRTGAYRNVSNRGIGDSGLPITPYTGVTGTWEESSPIATATPATPAAPVFAAQSSVASPAVSTPSAPKGITAWDPNAGTNFVPYVPPKEGVRRILTTEPNPPVIGDENTILPPQPGVVAEAARRGIGIEETGGTPGGNLSQVVMTPEQQAEVEARKAANTEQLIKSGKAMDSMNFLASAHGPEDYARKLMILQATQNTLGKSMTEEQLTARALSGDAEAQKVLDAMKQRKEDIAKTTREAPEKFALNSVKETINDPVAGRIMMSNALAQGLSPERFASLTQSTRGIQGTEAKNYLMREYSKYVQNLFPALKPDEIGSFMSARENSYKANLATQKKAQEFAALNNRAIEQATTMGDILQRESSALTKSGIRPIAALNAYTSNAINDPQYGKFITALNSYLGEYMKVVSGGALSVQQVTDSARLKGQELLSTSDSAESLNAKLNIMKQEMNATAQSWNNAVNASYAQGGITNIAQVGPSKTTGASNSMKVGRFTVEVQ